MGHHLTGHQLNRLEMLKKAYELAKKSNPDEINRENAQTYLYLEGYLDDKGNKRPKFTDSVLIEFDKWVKSKKLVL